jgi:hypothetical protein
MYERVSVRGRWTGCMSSHATVLIPMHDAYSAVYTAAAAAAGAAAAGAAAAGGDSSSTSTSAVAAGGACAAHALAVLRALPFTIEHEWVTLGQQLLLLR